MSSAPSSPTKLEDTGTEHSATSSHEKNDYVGNDNLKGGSPAEACAKVPSEATRLIQRSVSNETSASGDEPASQTSSKVPRKYSSMFSHMFVRTKSVDRRRRSIMLIDVVTESQLSIQRPWRLLPSIFFFFIYWYFFLPAWRDWGASSWLDERRRGHAPLSAGGPWAEVHWQCAATITIIYLLVVWGGVKAMAKTEPVQKRVFEAMFIYNVTLVIVNGFLSFNLCKEAWQLGFPYPWGNSLDASPTGYRLGMLLYCQYHCRQFELLDTIFVILRKKDASFLHIFLRLVHMWGWFFACRYACGGDSYFPAAVNSTCHMVVYLYYALSSISAQGVPLMRKARVTEVQVLQFVVCATHASYVLVHGNLPRFVAGLSLFVMMSGLVLYVEWDGHQPHFRPKCTIELSMFGHMFEREGERKLADLRRRALTLIDVVAERQGNGPLMPHRLLSAFGVSLVYWYFLLPAVRDWGISRIDVNNGADSIAGGPWAQVHWVFATLITLAYLFFVFAGVRAMERRPPAQKRVFEYMFIYNLTLVMLNAALSFNLWREAWRLGFPYPWGNALDFSSRSQRLGMLLWFQYHCRQLELLDTVFVIVRKKFHNMSFLHLFLRLEQMWGWFFVCRYACGGDSYFPAAVNSTCQVLVYLYYTLSLIDEKGVPLMRKARVTEVQVLQFVICATHASFVLFNGNLPRGVAALSLFVMFSSLLLYVDFAGDQTRLGPRRRSEDEAVEQRLTFRFDSSGWFYVYHFGVAKWLQEHIIPEGLSPEECCTDKYPKGIAFGGSSGGSLVAGALASGINIRDLFENVLEQHEECQMRPFRIFRAVENAMNKFLPENCAKSMSGRVRVLLTRISKRPPFITGEAVDQFSDWSDAFHCMRASCHVPGLNAFPYRYHDRLYFDGLIWSSLLVPWSGDDANLIIKVSATGAPLTDIRAPVSPPWWILIPPSVDALRGLFWLGYKDAASWFAVPPADPLEFCGRCRCGRAPANDEATDPLSSSKLMKFHMAQKLLLRNPRPLEKALPEIDPIRKKSPTELIAIYRKSVEQSYRVVALGIVSMLVAIAAFVFS